MAHSDRFGRTQPETEGSWVKVGRKHYRHESGWEVAYEPNRWCWYIVQDRAKNVLRFTGWDRLWAAQAEVERKARAGEKPPERSPV